MFEHQLAGENPNTLQKSSTRQAKREVCPICGEPRRFTGISPTMPYCACFPEIKGSPDNGMPEVKGL